MKISKVAGIFSFLGIFYFIVSCSDPVPQRRMSPGGSTAKSVAGTTQAGGGTAAVPPAGPQASANLGVTKADQLAVNSDAKDRGRMGGIPIPQDQCEPDDLDFFKAVPVKQADGSYNINYEFTTTCGNVIKLDKVELTNASTGEKLPCRKANIKEGINAQLPYKGTATAPYECTAGNLEGLENYFELKTEVCFAKIVTQATPAAGSAMQNTGGESDEGDEGMEPGEIDPTQCTTLKHKNIKLRSPEILKVECEDACGKFEMEVAQKINKIKQMEVIANLAADIFSGVLCDKTSPWSPMNNSKTPATTTALVDENDDIGGGPLSYLVESEGAAAGAASGASTAMAGACKFADLVGKTSNRFAKLLCLAANKWPRMSLEMECYRSGVDVSCEKADKILNSCGN